MTIEAVEFIGFVVATSILAGTIVPAVLSSWRPLPGAQEAVAVSGSGLLLLLAYSVLA